MLLQEAVEFVDRLKEFSTERDLNEAIRHVLGLWGIEYFGFVVFPRLKEKIHDIILTQNVPPAWFNRYVDQNYLDIDPGMKLARRSFYPFKFADAPDPEMIAQQMQRDLQDLGLANAVMFPISSPTGPKGVVWTQGTNFDFTAHAFLHTVILYTFERLVQFKCESKPVLLTPREIEALKWVAAGKSSWEAGEILHISQKTVEAHIASAIKKLDAGNRTHAVAIAIRDQIIEL